jgi:hypothetical protein
MRDGDAARISAPTLVGCGTETGCLGYKIHTGVMIELDRKSFV